MVLVATASSTFHARVIIARLGSAGILSESRGANEGPYPFQDCVQVLVPEDEAEEALDLLRADALAESTAPPPAEPERPDPPSRRSRIARLLGRL
jgi:hypothetical protein